MVPERRVPLWMPLVAAGLAGTAILYAFDPANNVFYPHCWLYATTGWQCPGCGGLRAIHSLLHGRIVDAFRFNPLLVLLLPAAACYGSFRMLRPAPAKPTHSQTGIPIWVWLLGGVTVAFGVARNLI